MYDPKKIQFMKIIIHLLFVFILFSTVNFSCETDAPISKYKTKNVIVVIMDGPRYSETWGDPTHSNIPRMANQLAKQGIIYTQFYNNGPTYTLAGHTSIATGYYQEIENTGKEYPKYPSMFQYWNKTYMEEQYHAYIIASKDKIDILGNCQDSAWKGRFTPATNCGVEGMGTGSGFRSDSLTCKVTINILKEHHPHLVLVNFAEPDNSGHAGNWNDYLKGIKCTDEYIYDIWEYIQSDSYYKGTTTFFYTNDHGRHLNGVLNGFVSHGDSCEGCRHINFFASGPDFKQDVIIDTRRQLVDLPATIAELLSFKMPHCQGEVMWELFKNK
jgi:hypothetical protein